MPSSKKWMIQARLWHGLPKASWLGCFCHSPKTGSVVPHETPKPGKLDLRQQLRPKLRRLHPRGYLDSAEQVR